MSAVDRLKAEYKQAVINSTSFCPVDIPITKGDFAELNLMSYFDFIPNDKGAIHPYYLGNPLKLI